MRSGGDGLATNSRVQVALRIFGENLEPDEVSALLGCRPTESHHRGDPLPGDPDHPAAETGSWLLAGEPDSDAEVESQVESLLGRLTADPDEWSSLTTRFSASLLCTLSPEQVDEGFEISPRLARSLAKRGLVIGFAVHDAGDAS